jgi:predicted peptidase
VRTRVLVLTALAAILLAYLTAGCRSSRPPERPFVHATVKLRHHSLPYANYLPPGYSASKKWPVILFLHGFNQRGEDGIAQTRVGIGPSLQQRSELLPCLVVMPQMPRSRVRWSGMVNELALAALDAVVRKYHGDRHRLYLTGCSMGGCGCWRMAAAHPGRFAAMIPICGSGVPAQQAPVLKSLPVWVFHGAADHQTPVEGSRAMVQAIRAAGSTKIRYTEYAWMGHICWNRVYSDAEVIGWLLKQRG